MRCYLSSYNPNTGINTHISDKTNRFFLANFGVRTIASWQPFSNNMLSPIDVRIPSLKELLPLETRRTNQDDLSYINKISIRQGPASLAFNKTNNSAY